MLIAAGVLFLLAMLILFIDKWVEHAGMDLGLVVKLLIFASVGLVLLNYYLERR